MWNLTLASADTGAPPRQAVGSPSLMLVAVEDLCRQAGLAGLQGRRPHRWQRTEHAIG